MQGLELTLGVGWELVMWCARSSLQQEVACCGSQFLNMDFTF